MAYIVKKGKGQKPFLIVNQKTGEVVGKSNTLNKASRSIGYREEAFRRAFRSAVNGEGVASKKK